MSPAQDNAISMLTLARKSGRTELTAHLRVPGTAGASLPNLTSSPWILGAGYHHPSLIEGETGIVRKWAKGPRPLSNWASQLCSGWLSKPTCSLMVLCCLNSLYKHCLSTVLLGWTAKSKSFTVTPSTPTSSISKFCWKRPLSINDYFPQVAVWPGDLNTHLHEREAQILPSFLPARHVGWAFHTSLPFSFRSGERLPSNTT